MSARRMPHGGMSGIHCEKPITAPLAARGLLTYLMLLLTGCTAIQTRTACRAEAGREPYGGMGGVIAVADPEWRAWNARGAACVNRAGR